MHYPCKRIALRQNHIMFAIVSLMVYLLLFANARATAALDDEAWDKLVWDYSDFTSNFAQQNWQGVYPYIRDDSKIGFGGETGISGLKQIYGDGGQCFKDMVPALKQGCKKRQQGPDPGCDAPPQWSDPSVIYLGARAGFSYDTKRHKWRVTYLICGGD